MTPIYFPPGTNVLIDYGVGQTDSNGDATINFNISFPGNPAVIVIPFDSSGTNCIVANLTELTQTYFKVKTFRVNNITTSTAGSHSHSISEDGSHYHDMGTYSAGSHSHGGSTGSVGGHSHSISSDGGHTHPISMGSPDDTRTILVLDRTIYDNWMNCLGSCKAGRIIDTVYSYGVASSGHKHSLTMDSAGSHSHGGYTGSAGGHSHSISSDGGHTHNMWTTYAGAHSHGGSTGSAGSHSHTVTVSPISCYFIWVAILKLF